MTDVTLDILRPGERAIIKHLTTPIPEVRQRLLELGMTRGSAIELIRTAPLGDPVEVQIKGYRLSLRKLEAEAIVVRRET